jgi:hypothetical protein
MYPAANEVIAIRNKSKRPSIEGNPANELPTIVRTQVSRDKAISRNPCDVFRHKESEPIGGGSPLFNRVMEAQVDPRSRDGAASGSAKPPRLFSLA